MSKVKVICDVCGTEFEREKKLVEHGKTRCSYRCNRIAQEENPRGVWWEDAFAETRERWADKIKPLVDSVPTNLPKEVRQLC